MFLSTEKKSKSSLYFIFKALDLVFMQIFDAKLGVTGLSVIFLIAILSLAVYTMQ